MLSCSTLVKVWNLSWAKGSAGWWRAQPTPAEAKASQHLPLRYLSQISTALLKLNKLDTAQFTYITKTNTNASTSAGGSSIVKAIGPDLSYCFSTFNIFITRNFVLISFFCKFFDSNLLNLLLRTFTSYSTHIFLNLFKYETGL